MASMFDLSKINHPNVMLAALPFMVGRTVLEDDRRGQQRTKASRNSVIRLTLSGVCAVVVMICARGALASVVHTDLGRVEGGVRHGVLEFRGIPYAAPPVGDLRWAAPRAAEPWKNVRQAKDFGPACPQLHRFNLTDESLNEDCLTLNISRPATHPKRSLPVIVYLHGGAFVGGSSNLYRLDHLAAEGRLVVVSINYRLGVLGFMPHPAFASADNGAYGLEDQRAALAWVQRNISAFGGDPSNVTLAGESAGAGSICAHLASPSTQGKLFDKAIILSGGCVQPLPTVEEAMSKVGSPIAAAVGCHDPVGALQCLRRTPIRALLKAGDDLSKTRILTFSPTVGTTILPEQIGGIFRAGKEARIPTLIGGARYEMRLYVGYAEQGGYHTTDRNFIDRLKDYYGHRAVQVAEEYPIRSPEQPPAMLGTALSDYNPVVGISNCLYLQTAVLLSEHMPVYEFEFADPAAPVLGVGIVARPDPGFPLGPVHSAMLNYLFPHMSNTRRINAPDLARLSQSLSRQMVKSVAHFAYTGVPGDAGLPLWPTNADGRTVMRFEPGRTALFDAVLAHHCDFWRNLYPSELDQIGASAP